MPQVSSELLVYAAIVAAFLLFNYVMQRLARKARETREATMVTQAPSEIAVEPLDDYSWGSGASASPEEVVRARAMQPTRPVVVPTVKPRRSVDAARLKQRLHSEQGLREAIVLMTILGPCRALEPYDPKIGDRPRF